MKKAVIIAQSNLARNDMTEQTHGKFQCRLKTLLFRLAYGCDLTVHS